MPSVSCGPSPAARLAPCSIRFFAQLQHGRVRREYAGPMRPGSQRPLLPAGSARRPEIKANRHPPYTRRILLLVARALNTAILLR